MKPRASLPGALPVIAGKVPEELAAFDNWVCWRPELRGAKWTKVPVDAKTGRRADSTDPGKWTTFGRAVRFANGKGLPGVGFVFTGSPFAGVDLDNCRDLGSGRLEAWAARIVAEIDSYTEVSPSGTGVKAFVRGVLPPGRRRKGDIEMYDSGRFFTVTGHALSGAPARAMERTARLAAFHNRVFGPVVEAPFRDDDHLHDHHRVAAVLDDAELVMRASSAANGEKFARLWAGDASGYADGDNEGRSEADLALCSLLAFWVGPDAERIDRLFRQSGLYRPKWERADYRARTIGAALEGRGEFWEPPRRHPSRSKARRVHGKEATRA